MNEALLTHEELLALVKRMKDGDEAAHEELVARNTGLVKSIVKRFLGRGVDYEDLYQIGCMGLVKALHNYDPSYNVRFSTYAVPMIAGEIKRHLRDDGMIKVSRTMKELAQRAMAASESLCRQSAVEPTIEEIAEAVGAPPGDVLLALEAARTHLSLFEPSLDERGDEGPLRIERIEQSEENVGLVDKIMLEQMLSKLEPGERKLIVLRYFRETTQSEIAREMGVSQVQVSRMESRIMRKLREAMRQ
ncbi:MAG: SigB/SigF/SigG family RNA polymerase sigma factor [Bacillota bacterium]